MTSRNFEFSGQNFKMAGQKFGLYIFVLIANALNPTFNMHAARSLMLYLRLHLLLCFVYENSKGPSEAAQLRSIARAFAVRKMQ